MNKKIIVVDYNPKWKIQFEELKNELINYIDNELIQIEHVGSTSILGLKAKPIIDLDIIIDDDNLIMNEVIGKLSKIGYTHLGDLGITGREAFKKENPKTPNTGTNRNWFDHNLYLCKKGSIGLENHINFRNYMRTDPKAVEEYGSLKLELATKYPNNIDLYIDGKTDFIINILNKSGINKETRERISSENKLK